MDLFKVAADEAQARGAMARPHGFPKGGTGSGLAQLLFDVVEVLEEVNDSGRVAFVVFKGVGEGATDVAAAVAEADLVGVVFLVAGVDGVAIDLEDALPTAKVFAEGLFEVTTAASILPTVADAAAGTRVIEGPDVSGAGFSRSGGEFFDG